MKRQKTIYEFVLCLCVLVATSEIGFAQDCPTIKIETPSELTQSGDTFVVRAVLKSTTVIKNLNYNWTISGGIIKKGQGSDTLVVQTNKEDGGTNILVYLTVSGLSPECEKTAQETVGVAYVCVLPITLDEFESPGANEIRARIDSVFIQLDKDPDMIGLFIMDFDQTERRSARVLRIKRILDAVRYRKYDLNRIAFVISQKIDSRSTRIYMIPANGFSGFTAGESSIRGPDMPEKLKTLFQNIK